MDFTDSAIVCAIFLSFHILFVPLHFNFENLPVSDSMPEPVRTGYRAQNPVPENPYPTYAQFVEGAHLFAMK